MKLSLVITAVGQDPASVKAIFAHAISCKEDGDETAWGSLPFVAYTSDSLRLGRLTYLRQDLRDAGASCFITEHGRAVAEVQAPPKVMESLASRRGLPRAEFQIKEKDL
jgi:hypothetical protein